MTDEEMEGKKEKSIKKTLDVLLKMQEVTLPQCHTAEGIIKNIQKRIDAGELAKESAIEEVKRLSKETQEAIENYVLGILKIIEEYNETEQFLHNEYDIALALVHQKGLFKK